MPKSKFFRVAVEGGTTDGRVIERTWLEQAAANYNPATYAARVNMEHIRGYSDAAPFNALGDVLALKTGDVEIELAGVTETRLALFAQIDATDDLVAMNKRRQKLYSSCELAVNFAESGEAYLVGLAVTDSPASLGTEMLAFAAGQGDASPLRGRKLDAANLFTAAAELALELEPEVPTEPTAPTALSTVLAPIAAFFARLNSSSAPATETPPVSTPEAPAAASPELVELGALLSGLTPALDAMTTKLAELEGKVSTVEGQATSFAALEARVTELSTKLDGTPAPTTARPLATGGNGNARTDC